jgi:hypothetical protein
LEGAYSELERLSVNGKLPFGDGAEVKAKYKLSDGEYARLRQRLTRKRKRGAVTNDATPTPRLLDPKADLHGYTCYESEVPCGFIKSLPRKGNDKHGYWGFHSKHVALNAYANGKIMVYPQSMFWKEEMVRSLKEYGWTGDLIDALLKTLKLNGERVHIGIRDPNAKPCPEMTVIDNGLYKLTYHADKTPYFNGTAEFEFEDKQLKLAIEQMQGEIKRIGIIMGGASIATTLTQMMVLYERQNERISLLESIVQTNTTKPPEPFTEKARENPPSCMDPPLAQKEPVKGSNPIQSVNQEEKQGGASVPGSHFSSPPISREQSTTGDCIVVDPKRTPSNLDKSPGSPPETFTEKFHQKPPEECPYIQKQKDGTYLCVTDSAKIIMQKGCWSNGFQPCFKEFTTCPDWKRIAG